MLVDLYTENTEEDKKDTMSTSKRHSSSSTKESSHLSERANNHRSSSSNRREHSKTTDGQDSNYESIHPTSRTASTSSGTSGTGSGGDGKNVKLSLNFGMKAENMSTDMQEFISTLQKYVSRGLTGERLVRKLKQNWSQTFFVSSKVQNIDGFYRVTRKILEGNEVTCNFSRHSRTTRTSQKIIHAIWPEDLDEMVNQWNENRKSAAKLTTVAASTSMEAELLQKQKVPNHVKNILKIGDQTLPERCRGTEKPPQSYSRTKEEVPRLLLENQSSLKNLKTENTIDIPINATSESTQVQEKIQRSSESAINGRKLEPTGFNMSSTDHKNFKEHKKEDTRHTSVTSKVLHIDNHKEKHTSGGATDHARLCSNRSRHIIPPRSAEVEPRVISTNNEPTSIGGQHMHTESAIGSMKKKATLKSEGNIAMKLFIQPRSAAQTTGPEKKAPRTISKVNEATQISSEPISTDNFTAYSEPVLTVISDEKRNTQFCFEAGSTKKPKNSDAANPMSIQEEERVTNQHNSPTNCVQNGTRFISENPNTTWLPINLQTGRSTYEKVTKLKETIHYRNVSTKNVSRASKNLPRLNPQAAHLSDESTQRYTLPASGLARHCLGTASSAEGRYTKHKSRGSRKDIFNLPISLALLGVFYLRSRNVTKVGLERGDLTRYVYFRQSVRHESRSYIVPNRHLCYKSNILEVTSTTNVTTCGSRRTPPDITSDTTFTTRLCPHQFPCTANGYYIPSVQNCTPIITPYSTTTTITKGHIGHIHDFNTGITTSVSITHTTPTISGMYFDLGSSTIPDYTTLQGSYLFASEFNATSTSTIRNSTDTTSTPTTVLSICTTTTSTNRTTNAHNFYGTIVADTVPYTVMHRTTYSTSDSVTILISYSNATTTLFFTSCSYIDPTPNTTTLSGHTNTFTSSINTATTASPNTIISTRYTTTTSYNPTTSCSCGRGTTTSCDTNNSRYNAFLTVISANATTTFPASTDLATTISMDHSASSTNNSNNCMNSPSADTRTNIADSNDKVTMKHDHSNRSVITSTTFSANGVINGTGSATSPISTTPGLTIATTSTPTSSTTHNEITSGTTAPSTTTTHDPHSTVNTTTSSISTSTRTCIDASDLDVTTRGADLNTSTTSDTTACFSVPRASHTCRTNSITTPFFSITTYLASARATRECSFNTNTSSSNIVHQKYSKITSFHSPTQKSTSRLVHDERK